MRAFVSYRQTFMYFSIIGGDEGGGGKYNGTSRIFLIQNDLQLLDQY